MALNEALMTCRLIVGCLWLKKLSLLCIHMSLYLYSHLITFLSQKRAKRWDLDETGVAMHAAHERKGTLHAKHRTHSGSEEMKRRAWQEIAGKSVAASTCIIVSETLENRCLCSAMSSNFESSKSSDVYFQNFKNVPAARAILIMQVCLELALWGRQ